MRHKTISMLPLVSILIPAYNAAPFLSRSVGSALAQTYGNIEIVIVDDGSTDETLKVANRLASQDGRVRVLHQDNKGPAEARRTALHAAAGEYIAYLDADDELLPDIINFLYERMMEHHLDMALGSMIKVAGENAFEVSHPVEGVFTSEEFLRFLFDRRCMCAQGEYLCRREVWNDSLFPSRGEQLPNEDVLMYILLSAQVKRVGIFNKPAMKYHYVPTSLTSTSRLLRNLDGWETFFGHVEEHLRAQGMMDSLAKELLCMKLDRLAFFVYPLDNSRPWVKEVIHDNSHQLSVRYKILRFLLHYPAMCHWCVQTSRRLKRLFKQ